jgi:predicted phage replisome organizer
MADVKWIKIVTDIFDDEKILLIESMPEADAVIVIWFKLLCLAGKNNNKGVFTLNDRIAYTDEMLATIFRRNINTVRLALKIFEQYGMIEIINGVITIPNWSKHQNLDLIDNRREYQRQYMAKKRQEQKLIAECKPNCKPYCETTVNPIEEDIDKEKDKEREEETIYSEKPDFKADIQEIFDYYTYVFMGLYTRITLTDKRKTHIKARLTEGYTVEQIKQAILNIRTSSFHCGENDKGMMYATIEFICRSSENLERWVNHIPKKSGNANTNKALELYQKALEEERRGEC